MLNQHQNICAPHPPHLLKIFHPLLPGYGDLSLKDNFRTLVGDMIEWVKLNPVVWQRFAPSADEIIDQCTYPTVYQIFKSIYDWEARNTGKEVWVCKSMSNYEFVNHFESEGLIDHYIFLYRDGRDVALSFAKAIVGPKSSYYCATQWHRDQSASIKCQEQLGDRVIALSYEDLIQQPEQELDRLFKGLGMEVPADVFDFPSSQESIVTANAGDMWKNVARPVIPDNKAKYIKEMSPEDQKVYESVAGATLSALGYPVRYWPQNVSSFSQSQLEEIATREQELKAHAKQRTDQHDLDLRKGQDDFLAQLAQKKVS